MSTKATAGHEARFTDSCWKRRTTKRVSTPKRDVKTSSDFKRHEAIRDTWGHGPRSTSLFDGRLDLE
jgi:hypothetical protein